MMLSLLTMLPTAAAAAGLSTPTSSPSSPQASDEVHYIPFDGGYKCKHCNYCAPHRNLVVRHARTHTGERPYACSYCSYRSSRLDNMRTHSYKCAEKRQKRNLGVMKGFSNSGSVTAAVTGSGHNSENCGDSLSAVQSLDVDCGASGGLSLAVSATGGSSGCGGSSSSGSSNSNSNPTLSGLLSTPVLTVQVSATNGAAANRLNQDQPFDSFEAAPSLSILPLPHELTDAVLPTLDGLYED